MKKKLSFNAVFTFFSFSKIIAKVISKAIAKLTGVRLILGLFFVFAVMVLLVSVEVNIQVNHYVNMINESTQNHLKATAQALSHFISVEELNRYHTIEDTDDNEYQDIKHKLIEFAEEYNVLYAYYWRKYGEDTLQYIVDNDTDPQSEVGPWSIDDIVEKIAFEALAGNVSITDIRSVTPTWDGFITAYAPVYDGDGNFYCVAGVDISHEFLFIQRRNSRNMIILQLIALPVSLIFGILNILFYSRKARQIEEAHNELQYFNENLQKMVDEKTENIQELQNAIIKTMAELVERRDGTTGGHIERTQHGVKIILDEIIKSGIYSEETKGMDVELLLQSCLLHDVGKISISDNILKKHGKLTDEEFEDMKKHTSFGKQIIEKIETLAKESEFLKYAKIFADSHHEKWSGAGYPHRLKEGEIPLLGRIMAIADVYDALVTERPYKKPFTHEEAVKIITEGSGAHFDPALVKVFVRTAEQFKPE